MMFKWLFGKGSPEPEKKSPGGDTANFEGAFNMVLERAAALKKEYERTRSNAEITMNIEAYQDPDYIVGCRDTILSTLHDPSVRPAHEILPVVATMFMTMATEVFPSNVGLESFSRWADSYSAQQRRELVRFAYLATVWEQEQAGARHPVAFASRIVLMTLAANANDDPTSKDVARELLAYINRVRAR
jgi:hypothetical protein